MSPLSPGAPRRVSLPSGYISLISFTQKGVESIKEGPKRLDAAKERFRAAGAELKAFYLITGEYDAVAISEAPNDEVVVKLAMTTAAQEHMDTDVPRVHRGRILEDGDVFVVATNLRNCTSQIQFCAGPGTLKSARAQPLKVSLR